MNILMAVRKMNKSDIVLVNADHPIDEHKRLDLIRIFDRQFVSYEAYRPFLDMYAQMKKEGLEPIVCSSYRSIEKQEDLFQGKCQLYLHQGYALEQAQELASQWVARPYCSEHHTGLAVDIVSKENERLDDSQEQTAVNQWLMKNSWKYGFILRYPRGKKEKTKVNYEPWHYRYVGKEHACLMYQNNMTLEEYLGK